MSHSASLRMSLEKTFKCRFILADGEQFEGYFTIKNRIKFQRYLEKHKLCKSSDKVDEIIFESMVLKNVR